MPVTVSRTPSPAGAGGGWAAVAGEAGAARGAAAGVAAGVGAATAGGTAAAGADGAAAAGAGGAVAPAPFRPIIGADDRVSSYGTGNVTVVGIGLTGAPVSATRNLRWSTSRMLPG